MTDQTCSIFVTGLRNVHALQSRALSIFNPQDLRFENCHAIDRRLEDHYRETENQIARLERVLSDLDHSAELGESMPSAGHALARDKILKSYFANDNLKVVALGERGETTKV